MGGINDETPKGPPPPEPSPSNTSGRAARETGHTEQTTDFIGPAHRPAPATPTDPDEPRLFGRYQVRELRGRKNRL